MFCQPAWAVGSYSNGTVWTKSTGGFYRGDVSPSTCTSDWCDQISHNLTDLLCPPLKNAVCLHHHFFHPPTSPTLDLLFKVRDPTLVTSALRGRGVWCKIVLICCVRRWQSQGERGPKSQNIAEVMYRWLLGNLPRELNQCDDRFSCDCFCVSYLNPQSSLCKFELQRWWDSFSHIIKIMSLCKEPSLVFSWFWGNVQFFVRHVQIDAYSQLSVCSSPDKSNNNGKVNVACDSVLTLLSFKRQSTVPFSSTLSKMKDCHFLIMFSRVRYRDRTR